MKRLSLLLERWFKTHRRGISGRVEFHDIPPAVAVGGINLWPNKPLIPFHCPLYYLSRVFIIQHARWKGEEKRFLCWTIFLYSDNCPRKRLKCPSPPSPCPLFYHRHGGGNLISGLFSDWLIFGKFPYQMSICCSLAVDWVQQKIKEDNGRTKWY